MLGSRRVKGCRSEGGGGYKMEEGVVLGCEKKSRARVKVLSFFLSI